MAVFRKAGDVVGNNMTPGLEDGGWPPEEFGNMHYGYVGHAAYIGEMALKTGSWVYNFASNGIIEGIDNVRNEIQDEEMIHLGYGLYSHYRWLYSYQSIYISIPK